MQLALSRQLALQVKQPALRVKRLTQHLLPPRVRQLAGDSLMAAQMMPDSLQHLKTVSILNLNNP